MVTINCVINFNFESLFCALFCFCGKKIQKIVVTAQQQAVCGSTRIRSNLLGCAEALFSFILLWVAQCNVNVQDLKSTRKNVQDFKHHAKEFTKAKFQHFPKTNSPSHQNNNTDQQQPLFSHCTKLRHTTPPPCRTSCTVSITPRDALVWWC